MAMLAERRSKVKWTLNPRGKLWQNEENKFGQKLMEKMGWSKGNGLGRNQQGELDPVRVAYKQDSKGLGFKWSNDDWIAHKEDFNAILANLNVVTDGQVPNPEPLAPASLEEKSKSSKSRVHYQKFTRGKDMSRYSQEDLKCILGERKKKENVEEEIEEVKTEPEFDPENEEANSHGVTTIKRGSIQDYFAQKLAKFKGQKINKSAPRSDDSDDERPSFGFGTGLGYQPAESLDVDRPAGLGFQTDDSVGLGFKADGHGFRPDAGHASKPNIFVNLLNQFETETTRKRKRRIEEIENATNEILEKSQKVKKETNEKPSVRFDEEVKVKYITNESFEEQPRKKKVKREKGETEIVVEAEINESSSETEGKNRKDSATVDIDELEITEEQRESKNKRKKSKKDKKARESAAGELAEEQEIAEPVKKKKKSKSKDREMEIETVPESVSNNTEENAGAAEDGEKRKSKKSKKKSKAGEVEPESASSSAEEIIGVVEEKDDVKSKKSKKKKAERDEEPVETEIVTKTKKDKKKKKENREPESESEPVLVEETIEAIAKVKKDKKKKSEKEDESEEVLLSAVGESSKKKRKREKNSDEAPVEISLPVGKKLENPQFDYVKDSIRPEKVKEMQGRYGQVLFDQFAGSNILDIQGYGS